jgi:glycosyltransferase involved in cell wall biosynthesis
MKVSIVIPAYNEEKWIGKTLDAASRINYPDYEILVIDNASADNTSAVVEGYAQKDSRIKLIKEPRKGILFAREAGRKASSGEIIAQLDADCLPDTDWITKGVSYFSDPDVVGISGPYYLYDAPLAMQIGIKVLTELGQACVSIPSKLIPSIRDKRALTIGGNFFIRASALKKIGGYDTSIDFYSEDIDTGHRLSKIGKILHKRELVMKTSARRHKAIGFAKNISRYTEAFIMTIIGKKLKNNVETEHPR